MVGVVDVDVLLELEPVLLLDAAAGAAVPCGSRSSVYRVPSAVFISVSGVFTERVTVCWPVAYEPPAIETFALFAVSETSWKIGFAAGKSEPAFTDSSVPLTEMTTLVGGGDGGAGGVEGVLPLEPDDPEEPDDEDEPDEDDDELGVDDGPWLANGSLLEKRENDSSWPGSAGGVTTAMSADESVGAAVVVVPASVGAAVAVDVGAAAGAAGVVEVVVVGAATGGEPPPLCIPMIVFAAYAIASTSTTASRMTIFFCFACFALAASATCFLATVCSFRAD